MTEAPADVLGFSEDLLNALRSETPLLGTGVCHLNNAGASPAPQAVLDAVREYEDYEALHGGYESAAARSDDIQGVYRDVAALIGCQPENLALVENATAGYVQALSAFDWRPDDVLVTTRHDYTSNFLQFLSLEKRCGVRFVVAPDGPAGGVDPDALAELAEQHAAKLVSLSWMPTNSGLVQKAAAVGSHCRALGIPYLIDACQIVGQLPIDVSALGCDYLSATGRKFLRGPRGTGFLYVSDRQLDSGAHPLYTDLRGATWTGADRYELQPDARRFENWEFNYSLVLGLGAAARYARDLGLERIEERTRGLAQYLRESATAAGLRVLDVGEELGAIVTVDAGRHIASDLVARLREMSIHTSSLERDSAVLDLDAKGAAQLVRLSPHYFNVEAEIDRAVEALASALREG